METFVLERLVTAATVRSGARASPSRRRGSTSSSGTAFGKPIGKFQAIRHRLADLYAELEAAAQLVYHAAWLHEKGENPVAEACMAKLLATELSKKTADECLQFFGGFGTVEEYPIERFFRDARFGTIVAGTSEIMREVIAKAAIDGVAFPKREAGDEDAAAGPPSRSPSTAGGARRTAGATRPVRVRRPRARPLRGGRRPRRSTRSSRPSGPAARGASSTESGPCRHRSRARPALEATEPSFFAPPPGPESARGAVASTRETPDVPASSRRRRPRPRGRRPRTFPPAPRAGPDGRARRRHARRPGLPSVAMRLPVPTNVVELFETLPLRFRADRAAGWNARFHFRFKDVARSDWTVVIEDGFCRTLEGHDGAADCVVTTTEKTYLAHRERAAVAGDRVPPRKGEGLEHRGDDAVRQARSGRSPP